jgi:hypothetical protein
MEMTAFPLSLQEISRLLRNTKMYYCVHRSLVYSFIIVHFTYRY